MHETPAPHLPPAERPCFDPTVSSLSAAFQAFEDGRWAAAVAYFEQARQEGISFTGEVWDALGTSLLSVGSTRQAAHAYEQAFGAFARDASCSSLALLMRYSYSRPL